MSALAAITRFHLRAGARLGVRAVLPGVVAAVSAGFLLGPDWIAAVTLALFGTRAAASGGARVAVPVLALAAASAAAQRVRSGFGGGGSGRRGFVGRAGGGSAGSGGGAGWLRHLPVSSVVSRRGAVLGVVAAQLPLLLLLAALAVQAPRLRENGHPKLGVPAGSAAALCGLALAAFAAAEFVVPARRPWAGRSLALAAAAALCVPQGSEWLVAGAALIVAADLAGGGLPRRRGPVGAWWRSRRPSLARAGAGPGSTAAEGAGLDGAVEAAGDAGSATAGGLGVAAFAARTAWRAVGAWRVLAAGAAALLPLASAAMFLRNPGLTPGQRMGAAVLGGGLGVTFLVSDLARSLAARRPAWPWSRSLPWTARRRVLADAALLGVPAAALALLTGAVAWTGAGGRAGVPSRLAGSASVPSPAGGAALAVLVVLALVPTLALVAAGTLRGAALRQPGSLPGAWPALALGCLAAAGAALLPWTAAAVLAAAPLALAAAVGRERRDRVTGFQIASYLAAGDSLAGSGE